MTDKIIVLTMCESSEQAEKIAHDLVEHQLAACVNIVPGIKSIYRWKGVIEKSSEWMLLIKTSREIFEKLSLELERLHTYETPEIVALPLVAGSGDYLNWLDHELKHQGIQTNE